MADTVDPAELLDVEVDHLARTFPLVAAHWLCRLQSREPVEPEPAQDAADSGRRHADLRRDLLAGAALTSQHSDLIDNGLRRRPIQAMRPGTAITQSRLAFAAIPVNPFANSPRADACGFTDGLRRLPARDLPCNSLSTPRRQTGILVYVHPVLPRNTEVSATSVSSVGTGWTTY
jgi:hypothetical protein